MQTTKLLFPSVVDVLYDSMPSTQLLVFSGITYCGFILVNSPPSVNPCISVRLFFILNRSYRGHFLSQIVPSTSVSVQEYECAAQSPQQWIEYYWLKVERTHRSTQRRGLVLKYLSNTVAWYALRWLHVKCSNPIFKCSVACDRWRCILTDSSVLVAVFIPLVPFVIQVWHSHWHFWSGMGLKGKSRKEKTLRWDRRYYSLIWSITSMNDMWTGSL